MSKLFCITGKSYFEIVFQYNGETVCCQYEGRADASRGRSDYKLLQAEYNTYGDTAALELLTYFIEHNNSLLIAKLNKA